MKKSVIKVALSAFLLAGFVGTSELIPQQPDQPVQTLSDPGTGVKP